MPLARRAAVLASFVIAAILVASCAQTPGAASRTGSPRAEVAELDRVLALALSEFDTARTGDDTYRVIRAQQRFVDGAWIWRVTLKAEPLLASDLRGAGGEVFVNVDLRTGETSHAYGE